MNLPRHFRVALLSAALWGAGWAHADAVEDLRRFVKDVQAGQGTFTQTVTSPDGRKSRVSQGSLAFKRPNQFRFEYAEPMPQLIVGDGKQVWLYDSDLEQVTVRPMSEAVGATPAAVLAGGALDKDFVLKNAPTQSGSTLSWVEAVPRTKDGQFQTIRVGFKQGQLAALEILDSFGQRSRLEFTSFDGKAAIPAARFQFTPPKGVDVLRQP